MKKLAELEGAGFIQRFKPFLSKKKGIFYKMIDEYSLFYFTWIEPKKEAILNRGMPKGYFAKIQHSPAWYA